jgi:formylmethanofuran--tetrahydromethanopterin N-formyltransferase
MAELKVNGIPIQDDYSETFSARAARILVTSINRRWAYEAAMETKGLGRSATAPPCEATLERELTPEQTPDGRPGFLIQVMDRKLEQLTQCLALRIRKGAVPNPQTSVFDAMPPEYAEETLDLEGTVIQKFGDGYEVEMEHHGRTVYRVPRMDGFLHVERRFGITEAVTGGMFLILADSVETCLESAEKTLAAVSEIDEVVVKCAASGSKVGAKHYKDMVATTNHHYCPLIDVKDSYVPAGVKCIYEIIVSAPREAEVRKGMRVGIEAATTVAGVKEIHTANYGGRLGKGKIQLHSLFD